MTDDLRELPQARNAKSVVVVVVEEAEASQGKAPNNRLVPINCITSKRVINPSF